MARIGTSEGDAQLSGAHLARGRTLLRIAYQVTGCSTEAIDATARALSTLPSRARPDAAELDRAATAALLRDPRLRRPWAGADTDPMAALSPRQRAEVVLAFGLDWDPRTIAQSSRRSVGLVRRDVAGALVGHTEEEWRALLSAPEWALPVPADLQDRAADLRRRRRARRLVTVLGVGAVGTLLAGLSTAVVRVVTAPGPLPATAHAAGLLSWPPRGDLVRDGTLRRAAVRAWRGSPAPPRGGVYVLYAGHVGGGRVAVAMQAQDGPGRGELSVVTGPASSGSASLRVQRVVPLDRAPRAVVLVDHVGRPAPDIRLLTAPSVVAVSERTVRGSALAGQRPTFVARPLVDGLSQSWVGPAPGAPTTAVRLRLRDGSTEVGLLPAGAVEPLPLLSRLAAPPPLWRGLPARFSRAALRDDVVWFAQACGDPRPRVELIWVGRAPGFPGPLRLERVTCGGQTTGRFLSGEARAAFLLASDGTTPAVRAYAAIITPPVTAAHDYVVVVGSRHVASITVPGVVRTTRVLIVRAEHSAGLRVRARDGTRVPLR